MHPRVLAAYRNSEENLVLEIESLSRAEIESIVFFVDRVCLTKESILELESGCFRILFWYEKNLPNEGVIRAFSAEDGKKFVFGSIFRLKRDAKKKSLLYMHIPKTAGSAVCDCLQSRFENCRTHIEGSRSANYSDVDLERLDFVAGHVRVFEFVQYLEVESFFRTTLLREPIDQLASHIKWVLYLCSDPSSSRYNRQPMEVKELGAHLESIDFSSISSIQRGFEVLSVFGHLLFNNCQTRYLFNGPDPIYFESHHAKQAIADLSFFDLVGTTENVGKFVADIGCSLSRDFAENLSVVNASPLKGRHVDQKKLAAALKPFYRVDKMVYEAVQQRQRGID